MILNKQNNIEFSSPVEVLFDREELKHAIYWYSKKPVCRLKHVYLHGKYYAVSIYDKKIHIHRLLMMFWQKRDLEPQEYVHHKNGNRFNNLKDNLELIMCPDHQSIHNKNRIFSDTHRHKLSEANKKRTGMKFNKRVKIDLFDLKNRLNRGETIHYISKQYGCDWSTVRNRIYENPDLAVGTQKGSGMIKD
jgi:hypothetical protein